MPFFRFLVVAFSVSFLLAGCAKPPQDRPDLTVSAVSSTTKPPVKSATVRKTASLDMGGVDELATSAVVRNGHSANLGGRVLRVGSIADLKLKQGEVILTFDDGPNPRTTPLVLAALAQYKAKATFFMVGKMAHANAATARAVANAGHTIGSHTHGHEDLSKLTMTKAIGAVSTGENEIARAIAPTGKKIAPFFRFPYLAQTRVLRTDLADLGMVVFDVDIDSLDFKKQSADVVLERTLARLDKKGKGIVLFHDIHMRTASLLPAFLNALNERGFKVVQAVPQHRAVFDVPLVALAE